MQSMHHKVMSLESTAEKIMKIETVSPMQTDDHTQPSPEAMPQFQHYKSKPKPHKLALHQSKTVDIQPTHHEPTPHKPIPHKSERRHKKSKTDSYVVPAHVVVHPMDNDDMKSDVSADGASLFGNLRAFMSQSVMSFRGKKLKNRTSKKTKSKHSKDDLDLDMKTRHMECMFIHGCAFNVMCTASSAMSASKTL